MTVYFGTMQPGQVIKMFKQCGALLEGHFQLSSGLHSPGYLQCALVLQHPGHASTLGGEIGRRVQSLEPEVVLSPALGGVVIGHEVARALGVRAVFTERRDGERRTLVAGAADRSEATVRFNRRGVGSRDGSCPGAAGWRKHGNAGRSGSMLIGET